MAQSTSGLGQAITTAAGVAAIQVAANNASFNAFVTELNRALDTLVFVGAQCSSTNLQCPAAPAAPPPHAPTTDVPTPAPGPGPSVAVVAPTRSCCHFDPSTAVGLGSRGIHTSLRITAANVAFKIDINIRLVVNPPGTHITTSPIGICAPPASCDKEKLDVDVPFKTTGTLKVSLAVSATPVGAAAEILDLLGVGATIEADAEGIRTVRLECPS